MYYIPRHSIVRVDETAIIISGEERLVSTKYQVVLSGTDVYEVRFETLDKKEAEDVLEVLKKNEKE